MKLTHIIVQLFFALQILILQFIFCSLPTLPPRPHFTPRLGNNKDIKTYGTPELGKKFLMYLEASSKNPLSYKWYKDDIVIEGAENDSFILDSLISENEGEYKCEVTALSASVFSNPYTLKLKNGNQETLLEKRGMVFSSGKPQLNKKFALYIKPKNDLPLTCQWYKDFEIINQVTNDSLLFWEVSNTDTGTYFCEVKHNNRTERSLFFKLELGNNQPVWAHDTMRVKINAGADVKLSLNDSCNDMDHDTLSFTLMPGKPYSDLIKNGIYEFKSKPGDESEYIINIKASDGKVASVGIIKITIHQENKPPELRENLPPRISIPDVNQGATIFVSEHETLQFTAEISDPNKEDKPTFNAPENMPKGAEFNSSSGVFRYAPDYGVSTEDLEKEFHNITFHATDNAVENPLSTKFVFHITVRDKKFIITAESETGGSIDPSGTIKAEPGKNYTFTMIPDKNWTIGNVFVNDNNKGAISTYTFENIQQNNSIKILFNEKARIKCLAVGNNHTHFLRYDNTLWATGDNKYGQLGDGTITDRYSPVKVFTEVDSVICRCNSTFVIRNDKTLWACGWNKYGQLGLGDTLNRTNFTQISDINNIKAISSGSSTFPSLAGYYTMIIKADGTLCGAGRNTNNILGLQDRDKNILIFTKIPDIPKMIKVSAGSNHILALQSVNKLWVYGSNIEGELGLTEKYWLEDRKFIELPGMNDIAEIAAAGRSTYIIKNDNSLWATGSNKEGQLGDGTLTERKTFVKIMDSVLAVSSAGEHTLILKNDNSLWAAGDNYHSRLGMGSTRKIPTPVKVLDNVKYFGTGSFHSIVLKNDNTVWGTGYNSDGQLGLEDRKYTWEFTEIILK